MKAGIETLEDVDREYGPLVGKAVTRLAAVSNPDADLATIVDAVVDAVEETIGLLGYGITRKEGF